jgi:16S rRNA (guanine527-N7)-methyltransferase
MILDSDANLPETARLPEYRDVWQATLGWHPDVFQQGLFQQLYESILRGNQQLNLTRITAADEFWEKHLWDSLRGIERWLSEQETAMTVIDIGTGAGFPGIPVAIARPGWQVTLLDATRKKVQFLEHLAAALKLDGITTIVDRAEHLGQLPPQRQAYDLALIRAVAAAPVCAEYALPLLKLGGVAVLYRGQWTTAEESSLASAVAQLGGKIGSVAAFRTPLSQSERHCIYLQKTAPTPTEFPRPIGVPTQQPLT